MSQETSGEPQSKPLDQVLVDAIQLFTLQLRRTADEVIGEVETKYLPHLECDTLMNVSCQARAAVIGFLCNRPNDLVNLTDYSSKEVREAIYRDHKEEIIAALGKDFEAEVKLWKEIADSRMNRY